VLAMKGDFTRMENVTEAVFEFYDIIESVKLKAEELYFSNDFEPEMQKANE
jgi:hypothetical protein